ncbi:MAG: metallophosphoesterase [Candidatus Bathyarchaeia archaeon]
MRLIRLLTPWPAMLLEDGERVLVASDFHLGLEYELAKMGINIPHQTERILGELLSLIKEHGPERLLLIGDIKHGVPITSFQEGREIHRFFSALLDEVKAIDVIRGNHDGNLQRLVPEGVMIHPSSGLLLGEGYRVGAFHGHAWPSPKLMEADVMVMGHNHPTVLLRTPLGIRSSHRVWVKGACSASSLARAFLEQAGLAPEDDPLNAFKSRFKVDARNPEFILMPAFNDLLGGLPINSEPPENLLGPLLRTGALDIDDFEVYLLDGTYLGRVDFLRGLA